MCGMNVSFLSNITPKDLYSITTRISESSTLPGSRKPSLNQKILPLGAVFYEVFPDESFPSDQMVYGFSPFLEYLHICN